MANGNLTEERLRDWLSTNQLAQERMCIALLSLEGDYSNLRPRRPKGGPDGGRDIEAIYNDRLVTWGAVGFRNPARDNEADKRWAQQKFETDLTTMLEEFNELKSFVFFTNVDLTPGETTDLEEWAKAKGLINVDIYNRERMRLLLDTTEGLAIRLRYLDIPMSHEEQVAFFSRFGAQLEDMMLGEFAAVDRRMSRVEFLLESQQLLRSLALTIKLDREYTWDELGHYRVMVELTGHGDSAEGAYLCAGGRDGRHTTETVLDDESEEEGIDHRISNQFWYRLPNAEQHWGGSGSHPNTESTDTLHCHGHFIFGHTLPITLRDMEHHLLSVYVTDNLSNKLETVVITANSYVIVRSTIDSIRITEGDPYSQWPGELTEEEQAVPWVSLMLMRMHNGQPTYGSGNWAPDLTSTTPYRLLRPESLFDEI